VCLRFRRHLLLLCGRAVIGGFDFGGAVQGIEQRPQVAWLGKNFEQCHETVAEFQRCLLPLGLHVIIPRVAQAISHILEYGDAGALDHAGSFGQDGRELQQVTGVKIIYWNQRCKLAFDCLLLVIVDRNEFFRLILGFGEVGTMTPCQT
jgi:hypothetical protein